MNCQNHPETPATAYCRTCGKPVCDACRREASGTTYCTEHAPVLEASAPPPLEDRVPPAGAPFAPPPPFAAPPFPPPYAAPPPPYAAPPPYMGSRSDVSPALAFFLGTIPGVGAIYNGQYAKGLIHAVVWGVLMSLTNSRAAHGLEPLFIMLVIAWWAYMALEAHHTARRIHMGEPVDEYSSLVDLRGTHSGFPAAAIGLILLGVVLLLHTLDVLDFEAVARFWPILLIAAGAYMLWTRFIPGDSAHRELGHEKQ